jgi:cytochrome b561
MPGSERYTATAIVLHWLVFTLIAAGFSLAVYMVDLTFSPLKLKYFAWHKWLGVTVFALALIRITWRLTHPPPPDEPTLSLWQLSAAHAVHTALYALVVVIPVTGWLYSSAAGVPTVYLSVMRLPDLLAKDASLAELLKSIHVTLNYMLLALVAIHTAAALQHHFFARDNVLSRMLPWINSRKKNVP